MQPRTEIINRTELHRQMFSGTVSDRPSLYPEEHAPILSRIIDSIHLLREGQKRMSNGNTNSSLKDGLLRLRLTDRCNAKCVFCGLHPHEIKHHLDMDQEWLYEYCDPLYKQIKILILTGGEPTICRGAFEYATHISREYPHITIMPESNGLAFDRKWQELAADNLFHTHFSINAASPETYRKGVWCGNGAEQAFARTEANVKAYVNLLKDKDRLAFAPSVSMVVNRHTANDIRLFVKSALETKVKQCCFFFDYTENPIHQMHFAYPEVMRPALLEIMKLEKALKRKFFICWRLWHPLAEPALVQPQVDAISVEDLETEYADVLSLAEGRSITKEHEGRNDLRKKHGKAPLSLNEDVLPSLHRMNIGKKSVCFAPWQEVDLDPNGRVDFCCWFEKPMLKLQDHIRDGAIDWDAILNSKEWRAVRRRMLRGDYSGCTVCCPMNYTSKYAYMGQRIRAGASQLCDLHKRKTMPDIAKFVKDIYVLIRLNRYNSE